MLMSRWKMGMGVAVVSSIFVSMSLLFGTFAAIDHGRKKREISRDVIDGVVADINKFAVEMYQQIATQNADTNIFISPFSISTALAMTMLGARGETLKQITDSMHLSGRNNEFTQLALVETLSSLTAKKNSTEYIFSEANRVFVDKHFDILEKYLHASEFLYHAEAENVDFAGNVEGSRNIINRWVSNQTMDRIKDLIPQGGLDATTKLVLANAVYFKGGWKSKFSEKQTKKEHFKVKKDKTVTVDMMHQHHGFQNARLTKMNSHVLKMPYLGDRMEMVVLLPDEDGLRLENALKPEESTKDKKKASDKTNASPLAALEKSLNLAEIDSLKYKNKSLDVYFPKFSFTQQNNMVAVLKELGMKDMFDMRKADLSGISGGKDLFVSDFFHKAFIEVNEEGSEAAAASAAVVTLKMAIIEHPFRVDRPFIFYIRDTLSGALLFMGRVVNPTA